MNQWSCSVVSDSLWSQSPPSVEFSRQEYWSGLPFPFPGHFPDPRIEPRSATLQADALPSEPPGKPTWLVSLKETSQRSTEGNAVSWWRERVEWCICKPRSTRGCQQTSEARRDKEKFSRDLRGITVLLDFRPTVSTTVKQYISVFLSHPVWGILLMKVKKTNTAHEDWIVFLLINILKVGISR